MSVFVNVRIHSKSHEAAAAALLPGATVCVCGATEALGRWDPKRSPQLKLVRKESGGGSLWQGEVDAAVASNGVEFKYVVLVASKHLYVWENHGPLHRFPPAGSSDIVHEFENGDGNDHRDNIKSAQVLPTEAKKKNDSGSDTIPKTLRVVVDASLMKGSSAASAASVVVCGERPELGQWNAGKAPAMRFSCTDQKTGKHTFESVICIPPGTLFKYVILKSSGQEQWEQNRPNRKFADLPANAEEAAHVFDRMEPHEGRGEGSKRNNAKQVDSVTAKEDVEVTTCPGAKDVWIPWNNGLQCGENSGAPRSIFHAFHIPFVDVLGMLRDLAELGFDAVQISPAQKSQRSNQWWARYQPKDYAKIEGLGDENDLKDLCKAAKEFGITVIADVVFNHMLVVAKSDEWERAQSRPEELERLKAKLSQAVGPALSAEDFQWPWFKMDGPHWDNNNRYEGWGCGEWSELRHCQRVVNVHKVHLQALLNAGVRGFRFDAVKHMRPAHIAEYVEFLRAADIKDFLYIYGEVLSVDEKMQSEYMNANRFPTTDFALTVFLNAVFQPRTGARAAEDGVRKAAIASATADGVQVSDNSASNGSQASPPAPYLSSDSIRFARNHDTVCNPGSFYGLDSSCLRARAIWTWLLAVHDGTVLVFPQDLKDESSSALLHRAVRYRARVGRQATSSSVCLRAVPRKTIVCPALVSITLRGQFGRVVGVCLVNTTSDANIFVTHVPVNQPHAGEDGHTDLVNEDGSTVRMNADGQLVDHKGKPVRLSIPPWDAAFLTAAPA